MYLYVAETAASTSSAFDLAIKDEITMDELDQLNSAFYVCSFYHSITQIKDIVIENGERFKQYLSPYNLRKLREESVSPDRAILLANQSVLNYASSIKTYIDMETRLLKKHSTKDAQKHFKTLCSHFYDNNLEYRFWANFRNYIVHCEFPYSIYQESLENGCRIICPKERLLKFDNWKHSKDDILNMGDLVDLPSLVDNMSSMILALYIDFFRHFETSIIDGINSYGEFCKKHNVKRPVIYKTSSKNKLEDGRFQPLPLKELRAAFDMLKSNPHVKINIKT